MAASRQLHEPVTSFQRFRYHLIEKFTRFLSSQVDPSNTCPFAAHLMRIEDTCESSHNVGPEIISQTTTTCWLFLTALGVCILNATHPWSVE